MKPDVRIKEGLPVEVAYTVENPPSPPPVPPRRLKFENEQRRMDQDKRLWWMRMVWGLWTTGK